MNKSQLKYIADGVKILRFVDGEYEKKDHSTTQRDSTWTLNNTYVHYVDTQTMTILYCRQEFTSDQKLQEDARFVQLFKKYKKLCLKNLVKR